MVAELTTKWLRRGSQRSVVELERSIRQWIQTRNKEPRPLVWHKTADEILESLATYCERISGSGHEPRSLHPARPHGLTRMYEM